MKVCCVEGCIGPKNEAPVFFEFPTSRLLRKRWLDAISAPPKVAQDAVICIRHFETEDYELVRGKTRLKSKVVPTLLVGEAQNNEDTEISQDSTETAESDRTRRDETTEKYNDSGKVHNDNEGNGNVDNEKKDNAKVNNVMEDNGEVSNNNENNEHSHSGIKNTEIYNDNAHNDNFNIPNEQEKIHNDTENNRLENILSRKVEEDNSDAIENNEKVPSDSDTGDGKKENNEKVPSDSDTGDGKKENNEKVPSDSDKGDGKKENNEEIPNDNEKVHNDKDDAKNENNEKVRNDIGKIHSDNGAGKKENNEKVPNDNGAVQSKSRKTRCKITAKRTVNGRKVSSKDSSQDSGSSSGDSVSSSPPPPEIEGSKDDIEGILTHYCIENKKTERQVAAMTDVLLEDAERRGAAQSEAERSQEEWGFEQSEPVFIELSVGHGAKPGEAVENDCLMVLESVQCEVDPALLLAAREDEEIEEVDLAGDDDDDDDVQEVERKKEDPISLLTSSDEDDVIIEEPNIDTVEVSSADTSEDDMPLVKLVKPKAKAKVFASSKRTKSLIKKFLWGGSDYYCVQCRFTTVSASEYTKHMAEHSKVLQLCQDCGFTTSSKAQMSRHKQKHKNERRYKCHLCSYSAKHRMSLIYHMKDHNANEVELAICDVEPASKMSRMSEKRKASAKNKASEKSKESEKSKASRKEAKKYSCRSCDYKTNRRSDLKRHKNRIHKNDSSSSDESD